MAKSLSSQMKSLKQEQIKQKENAVKNTTITRKTGREAPVTVKQGVPLDHAVKHDPKDGDKLESTFRPKVGANIGCTLSMGNYESMRIDCWLTDEVREGDTFDSAFARVLEIVEKQVEEVADQYRTE